MLFCYGRAEAYFAFNSHCCIYVVNMILFVLIDVKRP